MYIKLIQPLMHRRPMDTDIKNRMSPPLGLYTIANMFRDKHRVSVENENVILLDEKGKEFNSVDFSAFLSKEIDKSKRIVFVIGGPFGFSPEVYARANSKISLSKMTFSHQLISAVFAEQLYRAFTIMKGENYHHE